MSHRLSTLVVAALNLLLPWAPLVSAEPAPAVSDEAAAKLAQINHFVIIYQENHSFDALYGDWEGVKGLASADPARQRQRNQAGVPFDCLDQVDINLASPPLPATCSDPANGITSAFPNAPFRIDDHIVPADQTCPEPGTRAHQGVLKGQGLPGGCTADLVHRFYQEQYQLNGGRMDRYVTGSDVTGLALGYYDTTRLPLYRYLHEPNHPAYAVADNFFQAAFGGSYLNHQWLIAAATPVFFNAVSDDSPEDLHAVLDTQGMPAEYPLYRPTGPVKEGPLTVKCPAPSPGLACGDYAINTIQPAAQPFYPRTPDAKRLPPQTNRTIGESLTAAGIDWAWYSGGWSNANGDSEAPGWTNGQGPTCLDPQAHPDAVFPNCPGRLFQYHHQPFNFSATYAPGPPRAGNTCVTSRSSSRSPKPGAASAA